MVDLLFLIISSIKISCVSTAMEYDSTFNSFRNISLLTLFFLARFHITGVMQLAISNFLARFHKTDLQLYVFIIYFFKIYNATCHLKWFCVRYFTYFCSLYIIYSKPFILLGATSVYSIYFY